MEFILDHGSTEAAARFNALDPFTRGYIEALFFTESGTSDDGEMEDATLADLAPETWETIERDCKQFREANNIEAWDADRFWSPLRESAGRDFWYTRNGHGVGFWDGDWPEPQASALEQSAKRFPEITVYMGDDGRIYFS